jgi:hypothetical protein
MHALLLISAGIIGPSLIIWAARGWLLAVKQDECKHILVPDEVRCMKCRKLLVEGRS